MEMTEDQKLAQTAWECAKGANGTVVPVVAIRMLRDECGWTMRQAIQVLASLDLVPKLSE